jgi:hypothetical protein
MSEDGEFRIVVTGPHCTDPNLPGRYTYAEALAEKTRLEQNRHVRTVDIKRA